MKNYNRTHCLKVACNQLFYIRKRLQDLLEEEEKIKSSAVNLLVYEEMVHAKEEIISDNECDLDVVQKSGLPKEVIDDIVRRATEAKATE